jgi:membrane protease subunit HflC
MRAGLAIVGAIVLLVILVIGGTFYTVSETEQVIITQFGKPIGDPVNQAGLHVKVPFIQKANVFERRWLEWDGDANQVPTRDKKFIWVDAYARWRIDDPLLFFQSVRDERGAQTRLDDILDGATRKAIAQWELIEIVRSTSRQLDRSEEATGGEEAEEGWIEQIRQGRHEITRQILVQASQGALNFGIELVDVRIKRINYVQDVLQKVYERMISERKRIAEKSRSEGEGRAAEIRGQKERELQRIRSEAYEDAQEIIGRADAEATRIYAEAYGRDPDFYAFLQTLESYEQTIDKDTWLLLSTDSDFFRYLKDIEGTER